MLVPQKFFQTSNGNDFENEQLSFNFTLGGDRHTLTATLKIPLSRQHNVHLASKALRLWTDDNEALFDTLSHASAAVEFRCAEKPFAARSSDKMTGKMSV
ncbi:hypothetical protein RLEG12_08260 (plasmid) [Rhizobium leguminosarum bv. trifolii CB782]|nr:hypothetical protein RLEG12_08260 [Rhizobium leguminosarum bv. trifolii CB782]